MIAIRYVSLLISECCEKIKLRSNLYEEDSFKTLGVYVLQPIDVVENHNVYKHEVSNRHVAFSTSHGWTVGSKFCTNA